MLLGCFGCLSLSFTPAWADEVTTPESEATSGWPSMPLPNPNEVSDLLKTGSAEQSDGSETSDCGSATGNEAKVSSSQQMDSEPQGDISSITSDVQSIPDPTSHPEEMQQIRPPAVIVRSYQTQPTLNGSKDQSQMQSTADNNSK